MMAEPIRVLQIVRKMDIGGVQTMLMNYYRKIDKEKVQFDFIVQGEQEGYFENEILKLGGVIYHVRPMKNLFFYYRDVNKILKQNKYSIVHVHHNYANIHGLLISLLNGVENRISHSHNTPPEKSIIRRFIKKLIRLFINNISTHKYACSVAAADWLYGHKVIQKEEVTVIKNAIETDQFKFNCLARSKKRQELGLSNKIIIGHVGNFSGQKNHKFLIDIFNEVHKLEKNANLLLVGEGPKVHETMCKVDSLGLTDYVIYLGKRSDVNELYQAFDIFLFPSIYEGLGIVLVEAQAAGLKCVISDTITKEVSISELIEYLSLEKSAEEWAKIIIKKLNLDQRENMLDAIKEYGYDIGNEAKKLEKMYIEMVYS